MKQQVVVVSLGQLVASDINRSIQAFTHGCQSQGYWFAGAKVKSALLLDSVYHKTIDSYKTGTIDWDIFKQRITKQLGMTLPDDVFENAWNAMCSINPNMVGELKELARLQQEQGLTLVIPSATNQKHFEYIQQLFTQNGIAFDPNKTLYGLSYERNTLDNQILAQQVLTEQGLQQENSEILSLHKGIAIGTQRPVDTKKTSLTGVIKEIFPFVMPLVSEEEKEMIEHERLLEQLQEVAVRMEESLQHIQERLRDITTPTSTTPLLEGTSFRHRTLQRRQEQQSGCCTIL